jgi:hypothetical protein
MMHPAEPKDLVLVGTDKYVVIEYNSSHKLTALFWGGKWKFEYIEKCFWMNYYKYSIKTRTKELHKLYGTQWWIGALEQKEQERLENIRRLKMPRRFY